jgi:hypothetical protein
MNPNSQAATASHVADGDLLALLDEQPMQERARVDAHVARCEACANRLDRLRLASVRVSTAVSSIDVPPFDVTNMQRRLATVHSSRSSASNAGFAWRAAAVVVLAAGVAAASPLRGWLASHVRETTRTQVVPANQPATSAPQPIAAKPSGAVVWFAATGSELVIRFVALQTAGTLELVPSIEHQASAQIVARGSDEALLILPGELRVRNASSSTADYRVTVPADVHSIRLAAGNATRLIAVTRGTSQRIHLDASAW